MCRAISPGTWFMKPCCLFAFAFAFALELLALRVTAIVASLFSLPRGLFAGCLTTNDEEGVLSLRANANSDPLVGLRCGSDHPQQLTRPCYLVRR